jgi:hypothetical protein
MANPELAFQAWMRERFSNVGINAGKSGFTSCPIIIENSKALYRMVADSSNS